MNSISPPVLQPLRALFDAAVTALAADCTRGGKLDATRLDELQLASYEMAWAGADLLAAETLAAAGGADRGELDERLALLFIADARCTCHP